MEELRRDIKEIHQIVTNIRIEVAELKVKSGIWGVIGGIGSVLLMLAIEVIFNK